MRVVCAWKLSKKCQGVISDDGKGGPDSHGICAACQKEMEK